MSTIRRITAERMAQAWVTIPHVHQFEKADITDLESLRKRYNASLKDPSRKLTMTAILLKIATTLLKKYPQFNASLDMPTREIYYKYYYHVGVAVDTPRGLLVPVIRDTDKKTLTQIAAELNETADRAREGKVPPDLLKGGTFTITNLGGIGGSYFTPIVNAPEVAILGVARASIEQRIHDDQIEERLVLPLVLGYDHRVIDGADGARFMRDLAALLSNPLEFILEA